MRLNTGRRMTGWTIEPQKRLSVPACSAARPKNGILSALMRSPSSPSSAGSRVKAASTETTPTRIAPAARLRKIVLGTRTSPNMANVVASVAHPG